MSNFFGGGGGGFRIDPEAASVVEHDYWEEFSRVNSAFTHEPDIAIQQIKKSGNKVHSEKGNSTDSSKSKSQNGNSVKELTNKNQNKSVFYPRLPNAIGDVNDKDLNKANQEDKSFDENCGYRHVAVQTEGDYDEEPELPYKCCFCFRSSTPWVVWIFVIISIVFFKMGAIVTGRWIYLANSSFDEVVFYIAFSVCLGFATIYFRRGTKYHNPYDLLFLVLTVPIMWALLTFTTTFLKKDLFFYVGSGIYSTFIVPYSIMGIYITYKFWKTGKLFLRRVEGDKSLEPNCRKLFFTQSLIVFDTQITICAALISMAPTVNHQSTAVWISSLVLAPISICLAITSLIIGYFAIRKEKRTLTWIFTVLSGNQFVLIICLLLKRPTAAGAYYTFINAAIVFWSAGLLCVHIGLLVILWNWIVPFYGKGLRGPVNRTSQNNCIQCATLTICR